MWAAKSKGKGKDGKGKGKASAEGGPGHTLPRTRITAEKFTGTVVSWKGKYGWIQPAEEIPHDKASLRGGRLFTGYEDIIGGSSLDIGAEVEFHIFEDDSGLGAEEIVVTGEGTPDKGKGKGKGKAPAGSKGAWSTPAAFASGAAKGAFASGVAKGAAAKGVGAAQGTVVKGWAAKGVAKGWADQGWSDKGAKGKGKDKGKRGGDGHLLPRTRITAEKFTGTVTVWKGKYGWIAPSEPIEHEKATLHNGGIFVSINDIGGIGSLEKDALVEFHIAEDTSGLCAEEVVPL